MRSRRMTGMALAALVLTGAPGHAATERVLHRFKGGLDGAEPIADLLRIGSSLYGSTEYGGGGTCVVGKNNGCGTVFVVNPGGAEPASESVAYAFQGGSDGAYPHAGLINVDGVFYGTTFAGGALGDGTVYSLTPDGVETVLYSFKGGSDGANPASGLIEIGGTLYGTTESGGAGDRGTFYSITTAGVENVLHSFGLGSDGAYPEADLIEMGGTLFGITYQGGSVGAGCGGPCGTVYSITMAGTEKVLHSFQGGKDGAYPQGQAHLRNIRGTLYGTTFEGGAGGQDGGYGVVFSLTPSGKEKIVHAFTGANGDYLPMSGLVKSGATFYGATEGLPGSIYSIAPDGAESVIYTFGTNPNDGYAPYAGLTEMQAKLYGTTAGGGGKGCKDSYGCGTVFSINP